MGLILDSSLVIAAERRGDNVTQMLRQIVAATGDQRTVLSSVGLTELVHGSTAHKQQRRAVAETPSSVSCSTTWKSIPTPKRRHCWRARSTESNRAGELSFLSAIC